MSAQFSSWKRVPKSSSSPGTETGPRFWLSSSKVQAHAIRGPKLELRLGSHFWGPVMPILLEQKPHLLTQLVVVFKSKQNLAQLCSAASCRCSAPLKLKVVNARQHVNVFATGTFFHCARKILHEQERSTCLEAAAKGKSGKFSKPISHTSERAGFLGR